MRDFKKYDVWQLSHLFCLDIYKISKSFPKEEMYGLTSQLRRSAVSIPTNISEGCGRNSDKEFAAFLNIAIGSAAETENLLIIARSLDYLKNDNFKILEEQINTIKKKAYSLRQKLLTNPA